MKRNETAAQCLRTLTDSTLVRVYANQLPHISCLSFVVMKDGTEAAEGMGNDNENVLAFLSHDNRVDMNDWVNYSQDAKFGGDGSRKIVRDNDGEYYTVWKNGDFYTPFSLDCDDVLKMLARYEKEVS